MFKESVRELKNVRAVALCGMMGALAIVLNYVATIRIGAYIRIGFSFLPNLILDVLFGPAVGALFGGAMDVIKYVLTPSGAFFPGFTLSAMLGAAIYGMILYNKKVTWQRLLLSHFLVKLIVNVGLNSLWLVMLYGQAFNVILPARVISNLIMLPIDVIISLFALTVVSRILPHFSLRHQI